MLETIYQIEGRFKKITYSADITKPTLPYPPNIPVIPDTPIVWKQKTHHGMLQRDQFDYLSSLSTLTVQDLGYFYVADKLYRHRNYTSGKSLWEREHTLTPEQLREGYKLVIKKVALQWYKFEPLTLMPKSEPEHVDYLDGLDQPKYQQFRPYYAEFIGQKIKTMGPRKISKYLWPTYGAINILEKSQRAYYYTLLDKHFFFIPMSPKDYTKVCDIVNITPLLQGEWDEWPSWLDELVFAPQLQDLLTKMNCRSEYSYNNKCFICRPNKKAIDYDAFVEEDLTGDDLILMI
jgi:hypothetical protein